MADFKIEVPIKVEGKSSSGNFGEKIAEQIKKSLSSIGAGGGKSSGGGALIGKVSKMTGVLGAILFAVNSISFIISPIMKLLSIIMMLLLLPLIPILKPTLQALASFAKFIAPIMRKVSIWVEKMYYKLTDFITALVLGIGGVLGAILKPLGEAWDIIKSAGVWIWENIIVPGFEIILEFGLWIWEIFRLGLEPILNLGLWIWEVIKTGLAFIGDLGVKLWEFIKTLFVGVVDVGSTLWDWFKSLFRGTIDVGKQLLNWFMGLFGGMGGGGGKAKSAKDFILRPNGQLIETAPDDTIIGMKNPGKLGGNQISININGPVVRNEMDIKKIANEVSKVLQRQMYGRISSGI